MAGITVGAISWWYQNTRPVSLANVSNKNFLISKGSSAWQIARGLEKEGLIKNALVFKVYVQVTGLSKKIQAGEYRLSPSFSLYKVIGELVRGPAEIWVTIPEGLRREEIAQRFAVSLEKDADFIDDFLAASKDKEGFLFPDTYLFPKDASASLIIDKMTLTFDKKVGVDITRPQIIMASILERETKTNEERPVVAGILYKRLKAGWPLQVDAAPETYEKQGLPKNPICNPGLSSIDASRNPQNSPFWFYLHDTKGQVHYAKTFGEHNANVKKYLGN